MERRTEGYQGRLLTALRVGPRPMSVRQLAEEFRRLKTEGLVAADLRGSTYGGLRQYAEGRVTNPRVELLREIAAVLEVRGEWLAFDSGPMLEGEAVAEKGGTGAAAAGAARSGTPPDMQDPSPTAQQIEAALLEGLPGLREANHASWYAVGELYEALSTSPLRLSQIGAGMKAFAESKGSAPQIMQAVQLGFAREAGSLVGAAAREAGVDLTTLNRWFLNRYIQTTAQALAMLFVAPHRLQPGPVAWGATVKADGTVVPAGVTRGEKTAKAKEKRPPKNAVKRRGGQ